MSKIVFFEREDWEEPILKQAFPDQELVLQNGPLTMENVAAVNGAEVVSIFVDSPISGELLEKMPGLKFVTTRSTGYDHIDLAACGGKNIAVAYVPGYGDNTVAEYTFGLILNLTRKIYQAIDRVKETGTFDSTGLKGIDIKGKTIGVIGTGRIGMEVIKIAKGFGLNVVAHTAHPDDSVAQTGGFKYVGLADLLSASDIITLHCPLTVETHHLINMDNIKNFKKGSYLINAARGGLVDTEALVWGLEQKILAGAGLDVLEEEGEIKDELNFTNHPHPNTESLRMMIENHVLMKMPNVLVSPHNAFNSQEALERILQTTIENIRGYLSGKPVNLVPHDN